MTIKHLRIASRNSPLAMAQSTLIKNRLEQLHPQLEVSIKGFVTQGDKLLASSLATQGGKGLFVKELESALLNHEADIAVHSSKDMPVDTPEGLALNIFCQRDDPRDALMTNTQHTLFTLPEGAVVGTSSLRRQCLLQFFRPDLTVKLCRGNINTRLQKLDEGQYDALILAAAGLHRMELQQRISEYLQPEQFIPAPTQGVLCVETRQHDSAIAELLQPLHHQPTAYIVQAERSLNQAIGGGCHVPIGAFATQKQDHLLLKAFVGTPEGSKIILCQGIMKQAHAIDLGKKVAADLQSMGAHEILQDVYSSPSTLRPAP